VGRERERESTGATLWVMRRLPYLLVDFEAAPVVAFVDVRHGVGLGSAVHAHDVRARLWESAKLKMMPGLSARLVGYIPFRPNVKRLI
jgi:hypothetical protein